jgi:hypothetical protein
MKFALLLSLISLSALAHGLKLEDYNWQLTDVTSKNFTKEKLFSSMDRDFINTSSSICSNRAHMWVNNFKKSLNIDTAKIFLFYTKKKGSISLKTWWYHVAPAINENGQVWVMDAGFPGSKEDWLYIFAASKNCKEIKANETELVELIFSGRTFPHETSYGRYDCYYKVTPHTFWTPQVVAMNLLGRDAEGRAVRVERDEIDKNELYQACLEATTSKIGYALGHNKKECKEYAKID